MKFKQSKTVEEICDYPMAIFGIGITKARGATNIKISRQCTSPKGQTVTYSIVAKHWCSEIPEHLSNGIDFASEAGLHLFVGL